MRNDLHRRKNQVEQESAAKTSLLREMSDELRTSASTVLGCVDRIREEGLAKEEICESIDLIDANCKHLLQLVNDILDLAKRESDCLEPERLIVGTADSASAAVVS